MLNIKRVCEEQWGQKKCPCELIISSLYVALRCLLKLENMQSVHKALTDSPVTHSDAKLAENLAKVYEPLQQLCDCARPLRELSQFSSSSSAPAFGRARKGNKLAHTLRQTAAHVMEAAITHEREWSCEYQAHIQYNIMTLTDAVHQYVTTTASAALGLHCCQVTCKHFLLSSCFE